jgi:hypothetical protein
LPTAEAVAQTVDEAVDEVVDEPPVKAPKRRRAAAGTGRKPARASRKAPAAVVVAPPEAQPQPVLVPIIRSGSTDRHLVLDDIPVDPEPVRRPRSVRDLDAVPDDFD